MLGKSVVKKCWREVFRDLLEKDMERQSWWLSFDGKAVAARGTRRLTKNKEPLLLLRHGRCVRATKRAPISNLHLGLWVVQLLLMSQPVLFRLLWMFNTRFGLQLQGPKVFDANPWWWCQGNYWRRWEWHPSNRWTGAVACGAGTYDILAARSAVLWFWTLVQDYKTKDV